MAKELTPKPAGRPSKFTQALADTICERIADGQSLREVCRDEAMPSRESVRRWLGANEGFRGQYAQARDAMMDHFADEILEIAEDGSNDWMLRRGKEGEDIEVVNREVIDRSKLRIETRKWLMAKCAPKKYGEKVTQEITGKDGGPVQAIEWTIVRPQAKGA